MDRRKFIITGATAVGAAYAGLVTPKWAHAANVDSNVLDLIVQPEPPVLVPAINQQASTQYVTGKIYQSLLTYTFDLKPQPSLAKSWDISPDGTVYTFHLQDNVQWHDGKPFTADDVVFSLAEMLPAVHARARYILDNHVKSVGKLDDLTVQVTLNAPFPAFILMHEPGFAPMMPKHIYAGTDYRTNPANETPIGTGPFMFKEWKRGSYIRLVKNPDYWKKGLPHLDELLFRVLPSSNIRAVAFENKKIDVLRGGDVNNVDVERLSAPKDVSLTTKGWEMFSPQSFFVLNQRRPPFDNVKVRQAVMHALNREWIIKNIFYGFGKVATGPFVRTELYYDKDVPTYHFNMRKAKQLIQESGINPGDYTINQLAFPYGSAWKRLDEYTRQILKMLGFNVVLESTDGGGWAYRTGQWDFDLTTNYTYQYGDPALGVQRLYVTSNIVKGSPFVNNQGYKNADLDELWAKAAREVDPKQRQSMYTKIQTELVEDVANAWLFDMQFPTLYRSNIKNLVTTAIGLNESFDIVSIEK